MTELEEITSLIESPAFATLPNSAKKELRTKQQALIRKLIKSTLKEHLEPILTKYDLDSDIRVYNDGEDGIKVDFVEYWGDVDSPDFVSEPKPEVVKPEVVEPEPEPAAPVKKEPFLEHKLDWSPFEYGFTTDSKFHENIFKALGHPLEKGQSIDCTLLIDEKTYHIHFDCPNIQGSKRVRLLYSGKKHHVGQYLQKIFPCTYAYIHKEKLMHGGRHRVELPEKLQAMLYVEETDEPLVFRMKYKKS